MRPNQLFAQKLISLDVIIPTRYYALMIRSFKCSETEKVYNRQHSRKLPQTIQRIAMRKLWVLDAATEINELRIPPSNRLEVLRGNRKGQHSIRINQQWRICFRWRSGDAYDVEIVDYH
jgi:proteic killer suppression protein